MMRYLFYISTLLLFSACETVIDIDLEQGDKTIISEAYIDFTDTLNYGVAHVKLTESAPYFSAMENPLVTGAYITINDTYVLTESADSLGYYENNLIPTDLASEYVLDITATIDDTEGTWRATEHKVNGPTIDSIYYIYNQASPPFQEEGYYVKIKVKDPADEVNFYQLEVLVSDSTNFTLDPSTKRSSILTDQYVNGMDLDFEVNSTPFENGDSVTVILSSISEEAYYYYFNLYTLLTETSGIGAAPPFGLHGNVISLSDEFENAHGNFMIRSRAVQTIKILE